MRFNALKDTILIDTILGFGLLIYPNGLDNSVWLIDALDQSLSDASAYGSHSLTFLTHLKYLSHVVPMDVQQTSIRIWDFMLFTSQ